MKRYLLEAGGRKVLVDCGLFQGYKQLRLRNWASPAFDPRSIDAVILTHAHIDHSGYIPVLVRQGFKGPVFSTRATFELCQILLADAGHLQEDDAKFANRHGFSKHKPALPLFTVEDAQRSLRQFQPVHIADLFEPAAGFKAQLQPAGHLLGAAFVRLEHEQLSITFSGDLGHPDDPMMKPPAVPRQTDYLVVESTYGDRKHPRIDPQDELRQGLTRACNRSGVIVVPTFAIGRAQSLLLLIAQLKRARQIPDVPVFLDSPMAIDATDLYRIYRNEHRLSEEDCRLMCSTAEIVTTAKRSKALDQRTGPMIILSASGMATGGRCIFQRS